jgi:hypothetical protein
MSMNRIRNLAVFLLASLPLHAAAADLAITGNYGNPAGCRQAAGGGVDSDDLLLITPREVSTYATLCEFIQILPAGEVDLVATVICGHEGDETITLGLIRFRKEAGRDAFTVFSDDGASWGTAERCG